MQRSITSKAPAAAPAAGAKSNEPPAESHGTEDSSAVVAAEESGGPLPEDADSRFWWTVSGLSGCVAVGMASFGAHGLKARVTDVYYLDVWKTAAEYHMIHALALAAAPLIVTALRRRRARHGQSVLQGLMDNLGLRSAKASAVAATARTSSSSSSSSSSRKPNWAARCFFGGTVLFSGSLYALSLSENRKWGMVAPFGGAGLVAGWLFLAIGI